MELNPITQALSKLRKCHRIVLAAMTAVLWSFFFGALQVRAESTISKEYKVKATFLFNFVQFVDWPATVFADASTPITIGVVGDDPFGPFLPKLVQDETVKKRPLIVKRPVTIADMKTCHLLFICKSEKNRIPQILAGLGDASILTVSEVEGFALHGGVINFFFEGDKPRFEINPHTARRRGLKIGAQLLNLAKIVGPSLDQVKE